MDSDDLKYNHPFAWSILRQHVRKKTPLAEILEDPYLNRFYSKQKIEQYYNLAVERVEQELKRAKCLKKYKITFRLDEEHYEKVRQAPSRMILEAIEHRYP